MGEAEYKARLKRIGDHDYRVGVLGLGYVGLPVVVAFAEAGFPVTGFDVSRAVVEGIRSGRSHIGDVTSDRVARAVEAGTLDATTDMGRLAEMDAVIICVPTPLSKTGDPDVSYIVTAIGAVREHLQPGQLIILESTTYPGTTTDLVRPGLEEEGREAGRDFFLAFSPERVDPGNPTYHLTNTPKVVGGLTPACHALAVALYREVIDEVVEVSSPEAAEMTKILENTFRAVNIGLVNEMALIADRLGIDIWEVVDAAATKPYGFMRFTPGPGLGGHCIPIDPHYLAWKMRTLRFKTRFIELAAEVNSNMPHHVVRRTSEALNDERKPLNGSRILVVGVSYKPDVDDTRESPAADVFQLLREQGALVHYHDPHIPRFRVEGIDYESVPLSPEALSCYDAVVIAADHSAVDYDLLLEHAPIIVDPRNALAGKVGSGRIYPISGPARHPDRRRPAGPEEHGETSPASVLADPQEVTDRPTSAHAG